jgi:anaerobic ribonucleoside-triphosphate reductase activating protein
MAEQLLRVHRFLPGSRANGPGLRAVLWLQGCSLGCPGCFNPETHTFSGGERVSVDILFQRILTLGKTIEGLTLSGGEPLQQRRPLLALLERVRAETSLSVLLLTGFTWPEIGQMPEVDRLLACVDVLVAGRYDASQRLARHLQGSANKTIHFLTNRYSLADLETVPPAEVVITGTGEVLISGIDPPEW